MLDWFGAAGEVMGLAEKMQIPVAVAVTAKAVIDETFPHYLGLYNGKAGDRQVRKGIEGSDCLLSIAYRPTDATSGGFTVSLPADTIHLRGYSADVGDDNFQAVTLKEVLRAVTGAVPQVSNRAARRFTLAPAPGDNHADGSDGSAKLTQAAYWQTIQVNIRPGDVILADTSTSALGLHMPPNCTAVSQVIWGSIGYGVSPCSAR